MYSQKLKKNIKKNGRTSKTEADYNIIEVDLNIKWNKSVTKDIIEMYNLKNKICQQKF